MDEFLPSYSLPTKSKGGHRCSHQPRLSITLQIMTFRRSTRLSRRAVETSTFVSKKCLDGQKVKHWFWQLVRGKRHIGILIRSIVRACMAACVTWSFTIYTDAHACVLLCEWKHIYTHRLDVRISTCKNANASANPLIHVSFRKVPFPSSAFLHVHEKVSKFKLYDGSHYTSRNNNAYWLLFLSGSGYCFSVFAHVALAQVFFEGCRCYFESQSFCFRAN